jgi:3-oxoacyl-[acyl-carrier protein] reductase
VLNNKTAVITGGAKGIGKAISLTMAKQGASIALIYSGSEEAAREVCNTINQLGIQADNQPDGLTLDQPTPRAIAYRCNVADYEQVKATCQSILADFGTVDILVNNAGITKDNLILRMSEKEFDDVLDVNLKGSFNMIQVLSKTIMRSPAGRIINIASVSGIIGNPGQANYSASKAGLIGLTKTVAKELAPRKVTANVIAPGFIQTEMTENLPQSVKDYANTVVPLKRMGTPEEVANLAAFLASDQAAFITGEVIKVDGGMCM